MPLSQRGRCCTLAGQVLWGDALHGERTGHRGLQRRFLCHDLWKQTNHKQTTITEIWTFLIMKMLMLLLMMAIDLTGSCDFTLEHISCRADAMVLAGALQRNTWHFSMQVSLSLATKAKSLRRTRRLE